MKKILSSQRGFISLSLIGLGVLIISALALPVATRLVQERQAVQKRAMDYEGGDGGGESAPVSSPTFECPPGQGKTCPNSTDIIYCTSDGKWPACPSQTPTSPPTQQPTSQPTTSVCSIAGSNMKLSVGQGKCYSGMYYKCVNPPQPESDMCGTFTGCRDDVGCVPECEDQSVNGHCWDDVNYPKNDPNKRCPAGQVDSTLNCPNGYHCCVPTTEAKATCSFPDKCTSYSECPAVSGKGPAGCTDNKVCCAPQTVGCNQTCDEDGSIGRVLKCQEGLACVRLTGGLGGSYCRNSNCQEDDDCNCSFPESTPKPTPVVDNRCVLPNVCRVYQCREGEQDLGERDDCEGNRTCCVPVTSTPAPTSSPTPTTTPAPQPTREVPMTVCVWCTTKARCDLEGGSWKASSYCDKDNPGCCDQPGSGGPAGSAGSPPSPTAQPSPTSPTCGCPADKRAKNLGNANCDDKTDFQDFEFWRQEFRGLRNTKLADFNCDQKVDMQDFEIWRRNNQ